MKIILITIISLSLSSIAFAECSDEEKVEMLNAGVSAKYIKKYCEEFSDLDEDSKKSEQYANDDDSKELDIICTFQLYTIGISFLK